MLHSIVHTLTNCIKQIIMFNRNTRQNNAVNRDSYYSELVRRQSFDNFPIDFLDVDLMARIGFYYTGHEDAVICYFCEIRIHRWEQGDCPLRDHFRYSPECPLLNLRITINDPISEELFFDTLPLPPNGDPNIFRYSSTRNRNHLHPRAPLPNDARQIYFPQYTIESRRLKTFENWPISLRPRPEALADAGFIYDGIGDRVICFSCNLRLKDWEPNDIPWEQHALFSRKCQYLILMKGEAYIEKIAKKYQMTDEFIMQLYNEQRQKELEKRKNYNETSSSTTSSSVLSTSSSSSLSILSTIPTSNPRTYTHNNDDINIENQNPSTSNANNTINATNENHNITSKTTTNSTITPSTSSLNTIENRNSNNNDDDDNMSSSENNHQSGKFISYQIHEDDLLNNNINNVNNNEITMETAEESQSQDSEMTSKIYRVFLPHHQEAILMSTLEVRRLLTVPQPFMEESYESRNNINHGTITIVESLNNRENISTSSATATSSTVNTLTTNSAAATTTTTTTSSSSTTTTLDETKKISTTSKYGILTTINNINNEENSRNISTTNLRHFITTDSDSDMDHNYDEDDDDNDDNDGDNDDDDDDDDDEYENNNNHENNNDDDINYIEAEINDFNENNSIFGDEDTSSHTFYINYRIPTDEEDNTNETSTNTLDDKPTVATIKISNQPSTATVADNNNNNSTITNTKNNDENDNTKNPNNTTTNINDNNNTTTTTAADDDDDDDVDMDLTTFRLCKICQTNKHNVAFAPCGHVSCPKCALSVTVCPMCRSKITNFIRLYY